MSKKIRYFSLFVKFNFKLTSKTDQNMLSNKIFVTIKKIVTFV